MSKFFKILFLVVATFVSTQTLANKVERINIKGNQRVEKSTIQEYLGINIGDEYSGQAGSEAVKNLYSTSLFENINIQFNNGSLDVNVVETPFVSKVVFKGNHKVKTNLLTNEVYTAAGESLKKAKLVTDVEKIKEIYKRSGRFSVQVKSKIEPQENNRVKVIFEIDEGPKTGVRNIYFVGNENYKDSELKSVILTKESRWFRFLESNDTYDPERVEYDKHLIKQFYNSVGFADFRVISVTADLLPTKEGFVLTYSVEEGQKYKFGKTSLSNKLTTISDDEIWKFIDKNEGRIFNLSKAVERDDDRAPGDLNKDGTSYVEKSHDRKKAKGKDYVKDKEAYTLSTREGRTFNLTEVQKTAEHISDYLASKGYPQVDVHPEVKTNPSLGTVDVVMVIDQADRVFINRINIEGNLKTEDRVIRRQLKIAEGDVFNRGKIERGERNIRNLDYFGKMSLKLAPTDKSDRYDINIDVEEKSTSSIGFDVGYNTAGGPFGRVSFLERNLVGTGKSLNAGVQVGRKSLYYYGGLTDPNFMDRDLSLGGNIFRSENGRGSGFTGGEKLTYSMKSTGATISLGYDITDDLSHEIDYSIKRDELKAPIGSASVFIREQMGRFDTSAISHSLTYDRTDSRVLPKNGYVLTGTQEYAGLGGNTKFLKHDASGKAFKSFVENKYTIKLSAAAGHITGVGGKKVRISERFNLGDYSLRGFAQGGVGPRDIITDEGLGGQKYYTFGTELNFPVGLPEEFNVTGALFCDAGSLWDADSETSAGFHNDKTLRASVGFGIIWVTRIAPIRLDWGFPIKKQKYDEGQTLHIKFSTHF